MSTISAVGDGLLRQARLAQVLTLSWMAVEGAIALGAGIAARSIALTAFGLDSLVELFTAAVVLRVLLQRRDEERGNLSDGERVASRMVGLALWALVLYIALSSGAALLVRVHPEPAPVGIALTSAAIVIMFGLWRWRRILAARLGSPALRADAACSVVCLYLSVATLAGLGLNQLFGWWWADPIAALALIWWIRGEANQALEASRTGMRCDD